MKSCYRHQKSRGAHRMLERKCFCGSSPRVATIFHKCKRWTAEEFDVSQRMRTTLRREGCVSTERLCRMNSWDEVFGSEILRLGLGGCWSFSDSANRRSSRSTRVSTSERNNILQTDLLFLFSNSSTRCCCCGCSRVRLLACTAADWPLVNYEGAQPHESVPEILNTVTARLVPPRRRTRQLLRERSTQAVNKKAKRKKQRHNVTSPVTSGHSACRLVKLQRMCWEASARDCLKSFRKLNVFPNEGWGERCVYFVESVLLYGLHYIASLWFWIHSNFLPPGQSPVNLHCEITLNGLVETLVVWASYVMWISIKWSSTFNQDSIFVLLTWVRRLKSVQVNELQFIKQL